MSKLVQTTVEIPERLAKCMKQDAAENGVTVSQIVARRFGFVYVGFEDGVRMEFTDHDGPLPKSAARVRTANDAVKIAERQLEGAKAALETADAEAANVAALDWPND